MKAYKFLLTCAAALFVAGCYSDHTSRDYKNLDLPRIDNPTNDPALFVPNMGYEVVQLQQLQITPNVVYKDMDDLSYEWIIDGKTVATTKNLDFECKLDKNITYGVFLIHRKSAGNSTVFSFSLRLSLPLLAGFSVLVEQQGKLRYDFISQTVATLYSFAYNESAHPDLLPYSNGNLRIQEYWSAEKSSITGEMMLLDTDPNNCTSFNGETLLKAMTLPEEFIDDRLPDNFRVKDFMHGGVVSYLLAEDGRVFQRKCGHVYYTGRFSDLPMRYNNKEINALKLISTQYKQQFGLIYDQTDDGNRFLLVNLDYNAAADYAAAKAGSISEFPEQSKMSGIKGYELAEWAYIRPLNSGKAPRLLGFFRKLADGKYYIRQVGIDYDSNSSYVETTEYYSETYREVPDFGPDSKLCVIDIDGTNSLFSADYFYYTAASNPNKVLVKSYSDTNAPSEFHTFDKKVTAIVRGVVSRTSGYLLFAFEDNSIMMYATAASSLNPAIDYTNFDQSRIVTTFHTDGPIRWVGYKFGNISSY